MKNTIKCKNCGSEIEISEAFTHQIEAQVLASSEAKHKSELEEAKKQAEEDAGKKVYGQFETQLKNLQKEKEDETQRNNKLNQQLSELLDQLKMLKRKDEEREIEMKKKMMEEEEKIKLDAIKMAEEKSQLEMLELRKQLEDTRKSLTDANNKLSQKSQQLQGEVLELELERILINEFPSDEIEEVKKGERGADIVHRVIDKLGRKCGIILWESKNAKWDNNWGNKLKEDQRAKGADLAVLVTVDKPDWLNSFTYKDGIWISTLQFAVPLALALRFNLVSINHEKALSQGKQDKKEDLYQYLTGIEFKHRVEAIVEAFGNLQDDLEKEKRWFNAKWGRQEKEIRKVLDNTHGMYGELQAIVRSLPEIKSLELPEAQVEIIVEATDSKILS